MEEGCNSLRYVWQQHAVNDLYPGYVPYSTALLRGSFSENLPSAICPEGQNLIWYPGWLQDLPSREGNKTDTKTLGVNNWIWGDCSK